MINRGKELYPYLDLREKREDFIEMNDNSVVAVILFGVLTSIKDNNDQKKLISEIKRILKLNGIIYINDFLLNTDTRNLRRYEEFEKNIICMVYLSFQKAEYLDIILKNGLKNYY